MCLRSRNLYRLLGSACVLAGLVEQAVFGGCTVRICNTGTGDWPEIPGFTYRAYPDNGSGTINKAWSIGAYAVPGGCTDNPGQPGDPPLKWYLVSINGAETSWSVLAEGTVTAGTPNTVTLNYSGSSGSSWTNCIVHVHWENTGSTWAMVQGLRVVNGIAQLDENNSLGAVPPGRVIDFWVTNAGPCGTYYFGDTRDNATVPDFVSDEQQQTGSGTQPPPGAGPSSPTNSVPIVPSTPDQGGSTNSGSVTQADVRNAAAAIVQAIAQLERTVQKGLSSSNRFTGVTNGSGNGDVVNAIQTADAAARAGVTNLLTKLGTLSTNNVAGTTNDANFQLAKELGLLGDSFRSNAAYFGTNGAGMMASNVTYGWRTNVEAFDYSDSVGLLAGSVPSMSRDAPADFGKFTFYKTNSFDWKDIVSLTVFEWRLPGFKAWLRNFLLWMPLFLILMQYVDDIRRATVDVLGTPQAEVNSQSAGAFSLIPGVNIGVRVFIAMLIVGALFFIPSILTATVSTVLTTAGTSSVPAAATAAGQVLVNTPNPIAWVIKSLNEWLPYVEWCVFAVNYAVALIKIDLGVALAAAWVKAVGV